MFPQKGKILTWTAMRGCFHIKYNLRFKGVNYDTSCPWCNHNVEDDFHTFFSYCWCQVCLWQHMRPSLLPGNDIFDVVFELLEGFNREQRKLFKMTLWCMWRKCNEKSWENTFTYPHITIKMTKQHLHSWEIAYRGHNLLHTDHNMASPKHVETWSPRLSKKAELQHNRYYI